MSQHEAHPPSADWVAQDLEQMLRECSALIESYDEQLERLHSSVAQLETERERALVDRNKAQHVLDSLHSAVAEARQLRESRTQAANPHLRVVPDTPPPAAEATAPEPAMPAAPEAAAQPSPGPSSDKVVTISGERSVIIMRVVSSDADRQWSAKAVTEKLGESSASVRRVRAVLETLRDRGVLARRESTTGKKVFYELVAPWQAA